ncbi:hypothetical protein [Gorillibacterium massiliense]|uniref:DUF1281 family ferredoxin-like fold protein n=1 Tax=Gorillibacterium massiliense TaxID=1280390 RepID=UPI000592CD3E|nr:hypothetical protein [Gorillibacterium massiliense]
MANYITNLLTIFGTKQEVEQVITSMKDDEAHDEKPELTLDFEKIAPTPDDKYFTEKMKAKGIKMPLSHAIVDWRYNNWGTKWNPETARYINANTISLTTANGAVIQIVKKLSTMNKKLDFQICWSDSGNRGSDQGVLRYKAGKLKYEYVPRRESLNANKLNDLIENRSIRAINRLVEGIFK